jgi:hypothetical protein
MVIVPPLQHCEACYFLLECFFKYNLRRTKKGRKEEKTSVECSAGEVVTVSPFMRTEEEEKRKVVGS